MNVGEDARRARQEAEIVGIEGPVDESCFADDIGARHKTPGARIIADRAVIAQHKIVVGRHNDIVDLFVGVWIALVLRRNIGFVERYAIDDHCSALNRDDITWNSDDALNIILAGVWGGDEDNHVAALRSVEKIGQFVDHDMLGIMQAGFHADTIDIITLDGEVNDNKDDKCQDNSFEDFAYNA